MMQAIFENFLKSYCLLDKAICGTPISGAVIEELATVDFVRPILPFASKGDFIFVLDILNKRENTLNKAIYVLIRRRMTIRELVQRNAFAKNTAVFRLILAIKQPIRSLAVGSVVSQSCVVSGVANDFRHR